MTKKELTKGTRAWCWWKSRIIEFTGREWDHKGYNPSTGDYTPEHQYEFRDVCGAITMLTDADLEKLETR